MDFKVSSNQMSPRLHLVAQTATDSFVAMLVLSVVTTIGVAWLSRAAGMPSSAVDIAAEELRWFLPTFSYLWAMFYMIEVAK